MVNMRKSFIPLYRGLFMLVVTDDVSELSRYCPGHGIDYLYAHSLQGYYGRYQSFVIVLNLCGTGRGVSYGVLAHEVEHIKNFILSSRGSLPDWDNDEHSAYFVEWLYNEVLKWLSDMDLLGKVVLYHKKGD